MAINDPRVPDRELASPRLSDPNRDLATDPESGLDPNRVYQVVAMFETSERARAARDRLIKEGVSSSDVDLVDRDAEPGVSSIENERSDGGFWHAVRRIFGGHEHAPGYAEGLRRGHAMVVVRPAHKMHDRVVEILEEYDPIDFDRQQDEWRKGGWTGTEPLTGAVAEPADTRLRGTEGYADRLRGTESEQSFPIVEETMRVGKRAVDRGGIRVRSYVVERPFDQDVTLRDERVSVERRAVDRQGGMLPEDAFRERTIEVTASGEEAVVQKDARVVEEVVVRKDSTDRVEKVHDTVRKTEVEVEDTRTGKKTPPAR